MKAVYIEEFGPGLALSIKHVADPPSPAGSQVLVRSHAVGLNRADLMQARGLYPPPPGYSPSIPGLEFAGAVQSAGAAVVELSVGDRVFGITAGEAQAEYVLVDESLLTRIPANLSFTEAAAVPEAFITAHDAIFSLGGLQQGESLLIHAVGSGVGLAGLQLARVAGAKVIGTSRTQDKLGKCASFGLDSGICTARSAAFADHVADRTNGNGVDCILDLVGAAYFEENLASLASRGRLILVGLTSGTNAPFNLGIALRKRLRIIGTVLRPRTVAEKAEATRRFADEVIPLFESGKIKPNVDRVFAVADVIEAYKYLESNESFGKVVLEF